MILSYVDLLGDGQRHEMQATITTDHPALSYDQPVLILEDGQPLDLSSWMLLSYQVIQADEDEIPMLRQWLSWIDMVTPKKQEAAAGRPTYYGQPMKQTAVWLPEAMIKWLKSQGGMSETMRALIKNAMGLPY